MKKTQTVYKNCPTRFYAFHMPPSVGGCEVRFEGRSLIVSYTDTGNERCIWRCSELTTGHYECEKEGGRSGYATLHRFRDGNVFEGYWKQHDGDTINEGMWRITLSDHKEEEESNEKGAKDVEKGDTILIYDGDREDWVKCKVTGVVKKAVQTEDFKDLPFAAFGDLWKFPNAK